MTSNSLESGMTSLSSTFDSDLLPESLSARGGYDYVFSPKFGPGYECPICLLVLREPRQTKCGHRFCRDCLACWMKEGSRPCPVDNEILSENDIFPDNCIKREILSCDIKCPNHEEGCAELTSIIKIQKHLEKCLFSLLPCPMNCACVIYRRDIEDHQLNHCENRMLVCNSCQEDMPACMLDTHKLKCPKQVIECTHCGQEVLREQMDHHVREVCKSVVVACPFHTLGCNASVLRDTEGLHLSAEGPGHTKMLATSYCSLLEGFTLLAADLYKINKHNISTINSDQDSQTSIKECCGDQLGHSYFESCHQRNQRSQSQRNSENISLEDQNTVMLGGSLDRSSSNNEALIPGNESNKTDGSAESRPAYSSMPPHLRGLEENRDSSNTNANNLNAINSPKMPISGSQSVPILYQGSTIGISETPLSSDQDSGGAKSISQPNMAEFANSLRDLCSHQQQVITKQQMIVTNLCTKLASAEARLKQLEGEGIVGSTQNTCGDFYWSINEFSLHREKALREETSILHSPAFYSSPWGYKLCLRVNINGSFNAQGEHFVSLFIHFMQGNNDHLLNWPFFGQIVLSIVDQNPSCKERRHATETLKARPEIAAFQKPTSARNHKGFGYTDFIALNVLDNGNYIRDDTLIIRAQVFPSTS